MESEEEKKSRELRQEADHDTQIAREREEAQKRHRDETHKVILNSQLKQFENTLSTATRDLAALTFEESHLEGLIKKGYAVSSRESNLVVAKEEDDIGALRKQLDALRQKERVTESAIATHERTLSRARETTNKVEDIEERGRDAKARKQEHERVTQKLERDVMSLQKKIQDISRELRSF